MSWRDPDGKEITDPHYEALLKSCFELMSEVSCRLAHGASDQPAAGHLKYIEGRLHALCYPTLVEASKPVCKHCGKPINVAGYVTVLSQISDDEQQPNQEIMFCSSKCATTYKATNELDGLICSMPYRDYYEESE